MSRRVFGSRTMLAGHLAVCVGLVLFAAAGRPRAQANGNANLDLIGTPDLVVDTNLLSSQWVVRDEKLAATFCSVIEGGVTPGLRRLIRFTVSTPNIGDADLFVGDPNDHVAANDGLFELALCHNHYHFRHYALYELLDMKRKVWKAAKQGFCMLDTDPVPSADGTEPPRDPNFRSCGLVGIPGNQGISHGWADTYRFFLGGQYFVLDGGDGQPPVPPGDYIIRITVNPPYRATKGEPCRFLDSNTGLCHQFEESSFENNVGEVRVTIPAHPGRSGSGPMAGTAHIDEKGIDEHGEKCGSKDQ
jgi:hypothetical protein